LRHAYGDAASVTGRRLPAPPPAPAGGGREGGQARSASPPPSPQQPVHPLHERRRVGQRRAGGELGLLQQQVGEVGGARVVVLAQQALQQGVARIHLQRRLALRHVLAGLAQQVRQVRRHLPLRQRQAGRRIGQPRGHPDLADRLAEQRTDPLQRRRRRLRGLLLPLLLRLVQRQLALGHVPERL